MSSAHCPFCKVSFKMEDCSELTLVLMSALTLVITETYRPLKIHRTLVARTGPPMSQGHLLAHDKLCLLFPDDVVRNCPDDD